MASNIKAGSKQQTIIEFSINCRLSKPASETWVFRR